MAAELLLHADKNDYLNLIGQLDGKLNELGTLLTEYQNLKTRVNTFVKDGDSNYQNMLDNVENNVQAVRRAIGITQKSRDNLQKTVDQMEDMSTNVSNLMSETAEAAANTIKTAIRIEGLGL